MPPTLNNRPLLGTIADRDLFVPPRIMPRLGAAVDRGLNVLVLGPRGSGKTSLLRNLQANLDDSRSSSRAAAYVDLSAASSAEDVLLLLLDTLAGGEDPIGERRSSAGRS